MKKTCVLAMFILVAFLVTCNSPTSPDASETMILEVTGTVINAKTGLPIANAFVEVGMFNWGVSFFDVVQSTCTDKEGRYDIRIGVGGGYEDGELSLRARADGYRQMWKPDEYLIKRTTEVQTANFQLEPY